MVLGAVKFDPGCGVPTCRVGLFKNYEVGVGTNWEWGDIRFC